MDLPHFFHDDGSANGFPWPFCYIHGQAEQDNHEAWNTNDAAQAPDICLCDTPMAYALGSSWKSFSGTAVVPCTLGNNRKPAVCVVSTENGHFQGRMAYLDDVKGMAHVYDIKAWR